MTESVALPRAKARSKRRRPPGPGFWYALLWTLWDGVWGAVNLVMAATGHSLPAVHAAAAAILLVCFAFPPAWPSLKREWAAWRRDS